VAAAVLLVVLELDGRQDHALVLPAS
jgi:hypothetical protein